MTDDLLESRIVAAFDANDPGAWGDLSTCVTPATLSAAVRRIERGSFDTSLARSGFLALPSDSAETLAQFFHPERPGADYFVLALAASRNPHAVRTLASLLGDPDLATIAVAGLSRQRGAAFKTVADKLRTGKKAVRLDAIKVLEAWESDDAWKNLVLEQFDKERTADVKRALRPLVEDALGEVSTRTIDAIARSVTAEESEQIASLIEQALYLGGSELLPPELLESVDRAWVAAHEHITILADVRDGVVTTWWRIAELLEFTPVARFLSASLAVAPRALHSDDWDLHLQRLGELGPAAVTDVARLYGSQKLPDDRRNRLVAWLSQRVTDDDIDVVARRLRSPDVDERRAAEVALKAFGPPGGIAALEHLDAPLADSRSAAIRVAIAVPSRPVASAVADRLPDERAREPRALLAEAWFAAEDLFIPDTLLDTPKVTDALRKAAQALEPLELDASLTEHAGLPELRWSDGSILDDPMRAWLLARCRTQGERGTDSLLAAVAQKLEPSDRRALHLALLGKQPRHAEPWKAHTWVALGDLHHLLECRSWFDSDDGRAATLADARIRALSSAGELGIVMLLAWSEDGAWAPDRRRAAAELDHLAGAHGWTRAELVVRSVPTLGFLEDAALPWKLGSRTGLALTWRGSTLSVINESGELLQSIPSPRKDDDDDEVRADLQQLRALRDAAGFVERAIRDFLNRAMLESLAFPAGAIESWAGHAIVHTLAERTLWGVPRPLEPPKPLRFDESGTWSDIDEIPVELCDGRADEDVRPLHPADMSRDDRRAWMSLFGDYEIVQPFPQLARPVFRPRADELSMTTFLRFGGRQVDASRIRWLVWGSDGWRMGPSDSLWNRFIERPFRHWGLTAVIRWDPGFSIRGDDDDPPQVLRAAYIVRGCDVTDLEIAERISLIDAPPAVFSEIVYMIARAADAVDDHSFE